MVSHTGKENSGKLALRSKRPRSPRSTIGSTLGPLDLWTTGHLDVGGPLDLDCDSGVSVPLKCSHPSWSTVIQSALCQRHPSRRVACLRAAITAITAATPSPPRTPTALVGSSSVSLALLRAMPVTIQMPSSPPDYRNCSKGAPESVAKMAVAQSAKAKSASKTNNGSPKSKAKTQMHRRSRTGNAAFSL